MHPLVNAIMHALLVAVWTVSGYCAATLCLHPDPGIAFWAVVQPTMGVVLLWFVWPRKVVGHV